jgi:hypothetical protein
MIVQSARVIGRMEQTEMRVGVNTADFGSVELRAGISQDRVSATISAAHLELHAAMVAEMPSLERAIGQHQLHLDALDFRSPSGNQQRGAEAQQQHHPAMPSGTRLSDTAGPASQTESSPTAPGMETGSQRLNIHA